MFLVLALALGPVIMGPEYINRIRGGIWRLNPWQIFFARRGIPGIPGIRGIRRVAPKSLIKM